MQNFKSSFLYVTKQYMDHWQNENNTNCASDLLWVHENCYQGNLFQFGLYVINCVSFRNYFHGYVCYNTL